MRGLSTPSAMMMVGPGINGFQRQASARPNASPDDPQAKALLAEAGYGGRLRGRHGLPQRPLRQRRGDLQAVVAMLAKVGVKVNLNAQPKAKYFAKILASGGFDTSVLPARLDPRAASIPTTR